MRSQGGTDPGVPRGAERRQMVRKHGFVVNGSPAFLDVVRELLQDERCNVTTTNYVPHAFDQIASLAPDRLLVDLATGRPARVRGAASSAAGRPRPRSCRWRPAP
jgi:hypothetical protein